MSATGAIGGHVLLAQTREFINSETEPNVYLLAFTNEDLAKHKSRKQYTVGTRFIYEGAYVDKYTTMKIVDGMLLKKGCIRYDLGEDHVECDVDELVSILRECVKKANTIAMQRLTDAEDIKAEAEAEAEDDSSDNNVGEDDFGDDSKEEDYVHEESSSSEDQSDVEESANEEDADAEEDNAEPEADQAEVDQEEEVDAGPEQEEEADQEEVVQEEPDQEEVDQEELDQEVDAGPEQEQPLIVQRNAKRSRDESLNTHLEYDDDTISVAVAPDEEDIDFHELARVAVKKRTTIDIRRKR